MARRIGTVKQAKSPQELGADLIATRNRIADLTRAREYYKSLCRWADANSLAVKLEWLATEEHRIAAELANI